MTPEQVERAAKIAMIHISEEEAETLAKELTEIIEYVSMVKDVDTEGVPPTIHVLPISNVMREDESASFGNREGLLSQAPETENGHFKVPRII